MKKPSNDNHLIDFNKEKIKHIHNIHEKRLQAVHQAFEKAFPIITNKKGKKNKKK